VFNFKTQILKGVLLFTLLLGFFWMVESGEVNKFLSYQNPYQGEADSSSSLALTQSKEDTKQ